MAFSSADVPSRVDCIIDGQAIQTSLIGYSCPRCHRAHVFRLQDGEAAELN